MRKAAQAVAVVGVLVAAAGLPGKGLAQPERAGEGAESKAEAPRPGSLGYDKGLWHDLLREHSKLRRAVVHTAGGVEAVTESDDPEVAAKLIDHARAMQARLKSGARVRVWDPVFKELFAAGDRVEIEVAATDKGVRIVERSDDPGVVALLRSHAMGVSEFVRRGFEAAPRETPKLAADAARPAGEVAIGGVRHRFLLEQPEAAQLEELKSSGVQVVVNLRRPGEHPSYDEVAAAGSAGLGYCNPAIGGAAEMTDAMLDEARAVLAAADREGKSAAVHCRTGNRVGAVWAAYRVLDLGGPIEAAIAEARVIGMNDPLMESQVLDYIRRRVDGAAADGGWRRAALGELPAAQRARAEEARRLMFERLLAALGEAMARPGDEGGPAGAISVCRERAPEIAREVSKEKGVLIGRTSDRLRNPSNAAPRWAAKLIEDRPGEPGAAVNTDGAAGVTLPIRVAGQCLVCHGASEGLDPAVRAALAAKYPKDAATEYADGDLRGWFWIEVPAE